MSGTTPFPNAFIDDLMPSLKDTEWRLLCVIVRQTLGWQDKNTRRRKVRDWITQAQFVQKTGRDRAAISRALDSLVKKGYVEVRSEGNRLLHSPEERRQCKGRLFYGLSPRLLKDSRAIEPKTKSKYQELLSNSLLERQTSKSEFRPAPKANTTKETLTKENDTKMGQRPILSPLTALTLDALREKNTKSSDGNQNPMNQTVETFINKFQEFSMQFKGGTAEISLTEVESSQLAAFLEKTPQPCWLAVLQAFFLSDLEYVRRHQYSASALVNTCHIFLIKQWTSRHIEKAILTERKGMAVGTQCVRQSPSIVR